MLLLLLLLRQEQLWRRLLLLRLHISCCCGAYCTLLLVVVLVVLEMTLRHLDSGDAKAWAQGGGVSNYIINGRPGWRGGGSSKGARKMLASVHVAQPAAPGASSCATCHRMHHPQNHHPQPCDLPGAACTHTCWSWQRALAPRGTPCGRAPGGRVVLPRAVVVGILKPLVGVPRMSCRRGVCESGATATGAHTVSTVRGEQ